MSGFSARKAIWRSSSLLSRPKAAVMQQQHRDGPDQPRQHEGGSTKDILEHHGDDLLHPHGAWPRMVNESRQSRRQRALQARPGGARRSKSVRLMASTYDRKC
eukprot:scaffold76822_cov26-Phaeocystis_antarctica.AAC.1